MKQFFTRAIRKFATSYIPYNLKYKPSAIASQSKSVQYYEIYPAFQSTLSFSDQLYKACKDYIMTPLTVDVPPACVVKAEKGRIFATPTYTAIIDKSNHLIPEVSYHHVAINKVGHPKDHTVFRTNYFVKPVYYSGTVYNMLSGGGAAANYGHWLIDAIPRVGLLKKSGFFDQVDWFLVPNYKYDFHKDTLSLLGISVEKAIVPKPMTHIQADFIIASSNIRHVGHFPGWAGEFLRESYLTAVDPELYPPYVYIRRSDSGIRRILNEDELVARLRPLGFVDYELSRLSFQKKVNLFRSADIIVSATGAGLSNIVFCKPQTKVMEIFHSAFISTMFADIASKVGVDYRYIIKESSKKIKNIKEGETGHFSVDVHEVVRRAGKLTQENESKPIS